VYTWYGVKEARDARALEERAATTSADPGAPPGAMRCRRVEFHSRVMALVQCLGLVTFQTTCWLVLRV
jgi:hypothetical protein